MVAQIARTLAVRVPAALVLSGAFGLDGIWWCQPISAFASFLISTFFIFKVMDKIREGMELSSGNNEDE
jgi:Na+-driven multidrug efflux pump